MRLQSANTERDLNGANVFPATWVYLTYRHSLYSLSYAISKTELSKHSAQFGISLTLPNVILWLKWNQKLICLPFSMLFRAESDHFFCPCTKLWTFFQAQPDKISISRPDWFSSICVEIRRRISWDNLQMFPVTSTHSNGVLVSVLSRVSASLPTNPRASCRWGHIKIHCNPAVNTTLYFMPSHLQWKLFV